MAKKITEKYFYQTKVSTGDRGTTTADEYGVLILKYWNGEWYITNCANVGIDGIKPNTPYKLDNDGNFVEVKG